MVTAANLTELKRCRDNALRHMVCPRGVVQGQELDLIVTVGPFQLSVFCDSISTTSEWQIQ